MALLPAPSTGLRLYWPAFPAVWDSEPQAFVSVSGGPPPPTHTLVWFHQDPDPGQ